MNRTRQIGFSYVFLFPSFLLTMVLGVYPIAWAIRYMFYDYKGFGDASFIGFDNFRRLWQDTEYWHSVLNTFIYAGGKLILTLPLCLVLAVILNQKLRGRNWLRAIYFMPTIISSSVMAVVFFIIFNSYNGILNQYLLKFHIISERIDWLGPKHALFTTIIIAVWGAVGNYMLLFLAGLQNIPNDVYESSSLDGANKWQQFWYLTIPMLGPVLQIVIMLAIINSLKGYESIMVLTEGGPVGKTEVMYLYVYKLFFPTPSGTLVDQQFGYGSAVGFVTAVIVGIITLAYHAMSRRLNKLQ
ncbi:sugar ABC transporter permease [Paenibacillus alginolyticus]|uniref:Sugar ABC transporter permease n=1 Tax=Paenibacillus alginolyticus TaxID=59839 RepID=A0ABT4GHL7_9BACL|nr:sugar ABC transporter permease [Paenibacillus alginolyticus]MCY9663953.1 sugar ABC transporter permease [Paenibacillus alginolyticus]MCY9695682.1 sugar ABC transporter permease [Paenibacillus alginolyticus]MEC0142220.1 sugar ABC transporter permease [Paenibacillus alginolyticus]